MINVGKVQYEMRLTWNPTRRWQVYVIQESHHDLGYTDLPQHIFEEQNEFVDNVIDFCERCLASGSLLENGKEGPVLCSLIVKGEGVGCRQRNQEITMYDKIKRIDITNMLLKESTPFLEIYLAFPFKADDPEVKFEAIDLVITPLEDLFPRLKRRLLCDTALGEHLVCDDAC